MKVRDLIDLLETYPDDYVVVLSKDGEGNDFSPLDEVAHFWYTPETNAPWCGEISDPDEEDAYHTAETMDALVFWPVN